MNVRRMAIMTIAVVFVFVQMAGYARALSVDQKELYQKNIHYFDSGVCGEASSDNGTGSCCSSGGNDDAGLSGSNHEEQAYNFFYQTHSLSPFVASVIVGVLEGESGKNLNPSSYNSQYGAYGIAQWAFGRKTGPKSLTAFAQNNNAQVGSFKLQLSYVWEEISGGSNASRDFSAALSKLKKVSPIATSINSAVYAWEDAYETSGHGNMGPRYAGAHFLFHEHGSDTSVPTTDSSVSAALTTSTCDTSQSDGTAFTLDGYAWPVDIKKSEVDSGYPWPCPGNCHHDGTAAFDLSTKKAVGGNDGDVVGRAEFAISDGTVENVHIYDGIAGCYSMEFKSSKDGFVYWYGHMRKPVVKEGDTVKAGAKVAEVGERKCTGNGSYPHLHIDRGSPKGSPGGYVDHRDSGITPLINKLYANLPN